jgi:hypothetical protein
VVSNAVAVVMYGKDSWQNWLCDAGYYIIAVRLAKAAVCVTIPPIST